MRKTLITVLVTLAALSAAAVAQTASPERKESVVTHSLSKQKVVTGFFRGQRVRYLDLGPVKLKPGNKLAPIWVFTDGAPGQRNVIDTVPGRKDYSPLWRVSTVTWKSGAKPRVLKSAAELKAALARGELAVRRTTTVVNCPVLGFGQKKVSGFAKGKAAVYYDLGPIKLAAGNKVAPIWVFTNGASGQRNVIDTVPGDADYTPLWQVVTVTWREGNSPRVLRSAAEVQQAADAGEVELKTTQTVVNCPVF